MPLLSKIEIYRLAVPLREPFQIALMTSYVADNVAVRLLDRDGREGWGEVSPLHSVTGETSGTCLAAADLFGRHLLGKNALELRDRGREMAALLPHNPGIRSAFEMALHDLAAQTAGLPLYRFLGGAPRELVTDLTLGIGDVAATVEKARRTVADGFRNLKMKLGLDIDRDVAAVAAVREAVGAEIRLRLDANQAWGKQEAVENLRRLAPFDIQFCEQPVPGPDVAALRHVARNAPVPVMADEAVFTPADMLRVATEGEAPYANLKVAKCGGIRALLEADTVAETTGVRTMIGCMMESRLGVTASAHAALACRSVRFLDLDTVFELAEDPVRGGIRYEGDRIVVPDAPGLGASLDAAALSDRRVAVFE